MDTYRNTGKTCLGGVQCPLPVLLVSILELAACVIFNCFNFAYMWSVVFSRYWPWMASSNRMSEGQGHQNVNVQQITQLSSVFHSTYVPMWHHPTMTYWSKITNFSCPACTTPTEFQQIFALGKLATLSYHVPLSAWRWVQSFQFSTHLCDGPTNDRTPCHSIHHYTRMYQSYKWHKYPESFLNSSTTECNILVQISLWLNERMKMLNSQSIITQISNNGI